MGKIKFLAAIASVIILSCFYYRIQADTPFAYWRVISLLSEYRVLDSRVTMFSQDGALNDASLNDNLLMQSDLLEAISQAIYALKEKGAAAPGEAGLGEIEKSILYRSRLVKSCADNGPCNVAEWAAARYKAWEACEKLLSDFNLIVSERENSWLRNLRLFYISSVALLLSAAFFAGRRNSSGG